MTGSERLDYILAIVGALVPLMSAVSSLVNHVIRAKSDAGEKVSPMLSGAGTVLNFASINIDKAIQLANMARGKAVPTTSTLGTEAGLKPGAVGGVDAKVDAKPTPPVPPPAGALKG